MREITVIITLGLPGAGKSYHIENLYERLNRKHCVGIVAEDNMHNTFDKEIIREIIKETQDGVKYADYLLIDTFIPNNVVLEKYKKVIDDLLESNGFKPNYELHIFRPDPKYSYINDYYRSREEKSLAIITRMARYWSFSPQEMIDVFGNVVIEHFETYEPSSAMKEIAKKDLFDHSIKRIIVSKPWTVEAWTKENEMVLHIFDEEKPERFVELDSVLTRLLGDTYEEVREEIYDEFVNEVLVDGEDEFEVYLAGHYEANLDSIIDYLKEIGVY